MKKFLKKIWLMIPGVRKMIAKRESFMSVVKPGHFYSPIPDIAGIIKEEGKIWGKLPETIPGIDLNIAGQLELFNEFDSFYKEMPFKDEKSNELRYYFINPAYSYSDAIFLYFMMRSAKPKNIIEVGSGFSSCLILDTNDMFFGGKISCSFIEPYADLLKSLIKEDERGSVNIYETRIQDVPLDKFKSLGANDILFIDSTHVSKIHSDVNYIIHEILPVLAKGVYVHFHDIFYPFEYSKEWIVEGRAWNEQYILRAFLEFNSGYKIVVFNTYLEYMHKEKVENRFPLIFKDTGGSIWLKRI